MNQNKKGIFVWGCFLSFLKVISSDGIHELIRRASTDNISLYQAGSSDQTIWQRCDLSCCCNCFDSEEHRTIYQNEDDRNSRFTFLSNSCEDCFLTRCYCNLKGICPYQECWENKLKEWKDPDAREVCTYRGGYVSGACGTITAYEIAKELSIDCGVNIYCLSIPLEGAVVASILYWLSIGALGESCLEVSSWRGLRESTISVAQAQEMQERTNQYILSLYDAPVPQQMGQELQNTQSSSVVAANDSDDDG